MIEGTHLFIIINFSSAFFRAHMLYPQHEPIVIV